MMNSRVVRGVSVPSFLYGTAWKEERTEALARLALRTGFRGVDTANQRRHYVEALVGAAVHGAVGDGEVSRGDLFLQTKFTYARGQDHRIPYDEGAAPEVQVRQSFESSLLHLQTDHVDSYVLHGPATNHDWTSLDARVWNAMEGVHRGGKARLLGVSNVSLEQLVRLYAGSEIKPAFVQNRCFAVTGWDRAVRAFCAEKDIVYQGFSLLTANRRALATPTVQKIAEQAGRSVEQIIFRFALALGMLPLSGTSSEAHMREDLGAFEFDLGDDAVRAIERVEG